PEPGTQNPEPRTRNPEPGTQNPEPKMQNRDRCATGRGAFFFARSSLLTPSGGPALSARSSLLQPGSSTSASPPNAPSGSSRSPARRRAVPPARIADRAGPDR